VSKQDFCDDSHSGILGCDVVSISKDLPTFQRIVVPSSSGPSSSMFDPEDEGTAIVPIVTQCVPNNAP
jgi:hypothetical protein